MFICKRCKQIYLIDTMNIKGKCSQKIIGNPVSGTLHICLENYKVVYTGKQLPNVLC